MQVEAPVPTSHERNKRLVYAILLAQLLSVVLAVTGVSSAALTAQGVYAPTSQAFLSYLLLAVVYGSAQLLAACKHHRGMSDGGPKYAGLHACNTVDAGNRCCSRCSTSITTTCKHNCGTGDASDCFQLLASCSAASSGSMTSWRRICRMWPAIAALALIDVEANVLVVKAYQYTSLTSVTLLDCFTIPAVMLLSWAVLHSCYKPGHLLGAALCISGLAVLVLGDAKTAGLPKDTGGGVLEIASSSHGESAGGAVASLTGRRLLLSPNNSDILRNLSATQHSSAIVPEVMASPASINGGSTSSYDGSSGNSAGSAPLLGDALVLLGALLYAICNVAQELLLGDIPPSELLAGIGVFGAVFSGIQSALLGEWSALLAASALSQFAVVGPMLGFACAMLCFYSLVPQVLILGGATVLNISLLSSDAWAAVARFLWFGGFEGVTAYFFLGSLCMVAAGIVVYALSGSPKEPGKPQRLLTAAAAATEYSGCSEQDAPAGRPAVGGCGCVGGVLGWQPNNSSYSRLQTAGGAGDPLPGV